MRYGESTYGAGAFGGDAYGVDPGYVCDRLLSALSRFKLREINGLSTGCVKTIGRLTADPSSAAGEEELNLLLSKHGGLPAMLVAYAGGPFIPAATRGQTFYQTHEFKVVCLAGQFRDQRTRLAGRNVYQPGIDNLLRWAASVAGKALLQITNLHSQRPTGLQYLVFDPGRYVGMASFAGQSLFDLYDDATLHTLERLGLVHDPIDDGALFESDNETPRSSEPETVAGGVADLRTV